jgi:hypothetical protein
MLIRGTTEIKSTCYTKEDNHRGKKRPMHSTFSLEIYSRIWSAALFPLTSPTPCFTVYIYIEHIRQVKGQVVTFPDLTATLKSAGSFKKQGTEA